MAAVSPSGFFYGHFIQYVLPTLLGLCLFAPVFENPPGAVGPETLLFAAVLVGFIFATPISKLADFCFRFLPGTDKLREQKQARDRLAARWHPAKLSYLMSKDDREYVYQTAGFIDFYRVSAFCLLLYALYNAVLLWVAADMVLGFDDWWATSTPMLGGWTLPTVGVFVVSVLGLVLSFRNFALEYGLLFGEKGQYEVVAEKLQKDGGGIARSVWGTVVDDDTKPVSGARVRLSADGTRVGKEEVTDAAGRFIFRDAFPKCVGQVCTITVDVDGTTTLLHAQFRETDVPEYEVCLGASPPPADHDATPAYPAPVGIVVANSNLDAETNGGEPQV